jgi:hypothetical protein
VHAVRKELQAEDRLARTWSADQEGRPSLWQTTAGDFIETSDAGS